jgi:hypothetical protein
MENRIRKYSIFMAKADIMANYAFSLHDLCAINDHLIKPANYPELSDWEIAG